MTNFRIRGSKTGTQIIHREGEAEISFIDVPDKKLRGVGEALINLADAKDAISGIDFSLANMEGGNDV